MAPRNEEIEFAVRNSLQQTLLEAAIAVEVTKQKIGNFNATSTQGMNAVEAAAAKTADTLRKLTAGFNETGKSASNLTRVLGVAGLATAFYGITRGLESMSVNALNLNYTARELGMSGQAYSRLTEVYERLGFTSAQAAEKIAATGNILRDMGQKGPASEYYRQLQAIGGYDLAQKFTAMARSGEGLEKVFVEIGRIMPTLNEWQRRQLAAMLGAPERLEDFGKAMDHLTGRYQLGTKEAWNYHQSWMDLGIAIENFKTKIGIGLVSKLNELHNTLRDRGALDAFEKWLASIDIEKLSIRVETIALAIESILNSLGRFVDWVGENWKLSRGGVPTEERLREGAGPDVPIPKEWGEPPPAEEDPNAAARYMNYMNYRRGVDERPIILPASLTTGNVGAGMNLRELLDTETQTNRILDDIRDSLGSGGIGGAGMGGGPGGGPGGIGGIGRGGGGLTFRPGIGPMGKMPEGKAAENAKKIYDTLRSLGHSHEGASAVLGHVQEESNFNPYDTGDRGTAHGLGQHRNERWFNQIRKAREWGLDPYSPEAFARFFDWEIRNDPNAGRGVREAYFNAKTVEEKVTALNRYWRFKGWERGQPRRYGAAQRFAAEMGKPPAQAQAQTTPQSNIWDAKPNEGMEKLVDHMRNVMRTKPRAATILDKKMSEDNGGNATGTVSVDVSAGSKSFMSKKEPFIPIPLTATRQMQIPYALAERGYYE